MSLLLEVLRAPNAVRTFDNARWNLCMREIRAQGLCARVSYLLEDAGLLTHCPEQIRTELLAQRFKVEFIQAQIRQEQRKVRKALSGTNIPVILLKGAAYAQIGLPMARGRSFADLDIMVRHGDLERAETALAAAGWLTFKIDPYDQRYYRRWMHEIPPMRHPARDIELDVHHGILPLTSRLKPNPDLLWDQATALAMAPFHVLGPEDMLLHSAAHLLHDGEIRGELSGLLDLHDLIGQFTAEPGFWTRLMERADALQLGRPLHYGLSLCRSLFATVIPPEALQAAGQFAPNPTTNALVQTLAKRALEPRYPLRRPATVSGWLLYLRSHWLRMPPGLLSAHLLRKALRRSPPQ